MAQTVARALSANKKEEAAPEQNDMNHPAGQAVWTPRETFDMVFRDFFEWVAKPVAMPDRLVHREDHNYEQQADGWLIIMPDLCHRVARCCSLHERTVQLHQRGRITATAPVT
nr:hypothetical protein CFP56_25914 [Quercus suber]